MLEGAGRLTASESGRQARNIYKLRKAHPPTVVRTSAATLGCVSWYGGSQVFLAPVSMT